MAERTPMKAIGLTEFGGPEVLRVVELPSPEPGSGEVRIRVHAVAVNPTDTTFRAGRRAAQLADRTPPYIPGMDVAGVVDGVGEHSDGRLAVGDPVVGLVIPMGPHGGTYAEQVVVDQRSVIHAPKGVSAAAASTLLLNAVTAHLALDALDLSAPQAVAITGAAGAVGGYAVQIAKSRGLTVIADSSAGDEALVSAFGADHVVARGDDLTRQILDIAPGGVPGLTDGALLDGAALAAVADGGAVATLRGWNGPTERDIRIHPISAPDAATDTTLLEALRDLAEAGTISLRVADILPASAAAEAHRRLAAGGSRGRLVLDFQSGLS
ncbi:MAG: NADPH:quinone reductase [Pseudonocardiales bacterium]|nr:NADPH:quinone reductase [Pseudonocardiales bacterium]